MKITTASHALFLIVLGLVCSVRACSHVSERDTKYAPLLATAQGLLLNEDGYATQDLGQGLYMITDGTYQCMVVVSDNGVILVDAPASLTAGIPPAIGNVTSQPISHVVYSHYHSDHIDAAGIVTNGNVSIIAHELTKSQLEAVPHPTRPLPTTTFSQNYTLCVGNQTLELAYLGPNHVPGNIFIYAATQKTLMIVDIVDPGWVPFAQLALAADVPGYVLAQSQILRYKFDHLVAGHINRVGTRHDVRESMEYVQDLFNNCNATLHLPSSSQNSVANISADAENLNPGSIYAAFKAYSDIISEVCANQTVPKWLNRLGGADVFTYDNAYAVVNSLMLDYA